MKRQLAPGDLSATMIGREALCQLSLFRRRQDKLSDVIRPERFYWGAGCPKVNRYGVPQIGLMFVLYEADLRFSMERFATKLLRPLVWQLHKLTRATPLSGHQTECPAPACVLDAAWDRYDGVGLRTVLDYIIPPPEYRGAVQYEPEYYHVSTDELKPADVVLAGRFDVLAAPDTL